MKRMMALVLSLVMALSLCVCPVWGADDATEQAAQDFVDAYLSNDEGKIFGHVKGYDGSLSKMFASEGAWNELGDEEQTRVNELLDAAYDGLSYEKLWEWVQGFMFMVEYLVVAEGDYEGYIISTDPNGGTLVDPDPPHNTFAIQPFTQEIWQRIVDAEEAFNSLSDGAKEYLGKLMTEEGFGLNNKVQPADLPICNFAQLLEKAKRNLEAYEDIGSTLEDLPIVPAPEVVDQMPDAMVQAIADGKKVEVEVKAEMVVKDTVNSEKQAAFEQELENQGYTRYNIDRYLEIEVLMTVDGYDPVVASRTVEPIWIDLGEAKSGYDYAVLREHAGELTLLVGNQYVVVRGDGHVYVKSDLFSTYAVVEKPKTTGGYIGGYVPVTEETDTTVTSPKTFDAGVGLATAATVLSMTGMVWLGKKKD